MRERLIELIMNTPKPPITVGGRSQGRTYQTASNVADHLLANGVVILDPQKYPPVKNAKIIRTICGVSFDEAAELIDAKREGRIIVPPCKVGDYLYMPWHYDGVSGIAGLHVTYMVIDQDEFRIMTDFSTDDEGFFDLYNGGKFNPSDFGKTVFLTREEAEKALKERSGG